MEALRVTDQFIRHDGIAVTDNRPHNPVAVNRGRAAYPSIDLILETLKTLCRQVKSFDATVLAERAGAMAANMVLLGALSNVKSVGLSSESYADAICPIVTRSVEINLKGFQLGKEVRLGFQN
jgi:Pyruvate/2-oxoacid:ferredoxin oxidoreductase gamma subunit